MSASEAKHGAEPLVQEAAGVFHLLGKMASKHLVIVGGLVPHLLVPDAADEHIGSADIDFCLSVAITQGETRQYYKSIEELLSPHFELASSSGFRWRKKDGVGGLPLAIDFLAPASEEDSTVSDGTLELADDVAASNAGEQLRPFPIRSGALIDEDAIETTIEAVELFYDHGVYADVDIRHAGPVGFLAAKADALDGRDDSKDGYDVGWWCLNARPTAAEVAGLVTARPGFKHELFPECVHELEQAFRAPEYHGPSGYAKEKFPGRAPGDDDYERARNAAYAATAQVIEILKKNLWS
jgi:hypothetical protein